MGISLIDVLKNGIPAQVTTMQDAYDVAFASAAGYEHLGRHFDQVLRFLNRRMPADLYENRDDIHSVLYLMGLERAIRMIQWLRRNAPDMDVAIFWEWSERHFEHELQKLGIGRAQGAASRSRRAHLRLVSSL
jgi:hypothetical protein